MPTVTVSPKFQVVIPQEVREALAIRPGEKLQVFQFDNRIELVPVRPIRELRTDVPAELDALIGELLAKAPEDRPQSAYEVAGRPVLDPYPVDVMCDGAHGAPLIPWPNRLADGRYRFDGADYQVALTEPEKRNAIHGLMR